MKGAELLCRALDTAMGADIQRLTTALAGLRTANTLRAAWEVVAMQDLTLAGPHRSFATSPQYRNFRNAVDHC